MPVEEVLESVTTCTKFAEFNEFGMPGDTHKICRARAVARSSGWVATGSEAVAAGGKWYYGVGFVGCDFTMPDTEHPCAVSWANSEFDVLCEQLA